MVGADIRIKRKQTKKKKGSRPPSLSFLATFSQCSFHALSPPFVENPRHIESGRTMWAIVEKHRSSIAKRAYTFVALIDVLLNCLWRVRVKVKERPGL